MNDIIELIMGNMFVVIIIIGVLIKLFSGSKAKQNESTNEEQNENANQNKPQSIFQQVKSEIEQQKQAQTLENERRHKETVARSTNQSSQPSQSVEQQREAQLNRLKKNHQATSIKADNSQSRMRNQPNIANQEISDNQIGPIKLSKKLTQKGLIESVIMAEVLGSPRALNPYRSVTSNRHK